MIPVIEQKILVGDGSLARADHLRRINHAHLTVTAYGDDHAGEGSPACRIFAPAVPTGILDLATGQDHCLYGLPQERRNPVHRTNKDTRSTS
ncbi:hypothetical protein [Methanocalculus sp. MSAO_Arc2]|uniref:hypothetical protein n=1 Tax=Methanocalculus sp. MSAO_Arc2 TaxID=2293855 RepID=UPI003216F2FA